MALQQCCKATYQILNRYVQIWINIESFSYLQLTMLVNLTLIRAPHQIELTYAGICMIWMLGCLIWHEREIKRNRSVNFKRKHCWISNGCTIRSICVKVNLFTLWLPSLNLIINKLLWYFWNLCGHQFCFENSLKVIMKNVGEQICLFFHCDMFLDHFIKMIYYLSLSHVTEIFIKNQIADFTNIGFCMKENLFNQCGL